MMHDYYFDNNATTKISTGVSKAVASANWYLTGNPSSIYTIGRESRDRIDLARAQVAKLFSADSDQIIFTSGATEADNAIIHSALLQNSKRKTILLSAVEHPAVKKSAHFYENWGYKVIEIPVSEHGLNEEFLMSNLSDDVALVSIMAVNNETGMIFPVEKYFKEVKEFNQQIICHTDAVQAVGKTDIPLENVDYIAISAHKFHGPKGIGCIYKGKNMNFQPFILGGSQECGYRAGTENISGIIGLEKACSEVLEQKGVSVIQEYQRKLEVSVGNLDAYIVAKNYPRVPGVCNIGFAGIEANLLVLKLNQKRIFVSTGSACSSQKIGISPVIKALNIPEPYRSTIRISMSRYTTEEEVNYLIKQLMQIVEEIRR